MSQDRFLQLANSAQSDEQRNMFLHQHYRLQTRSILDNCRSCMFASGHHIGFQGKTPAFCSFISQLPITDTLSLIRLDRQLGSIGYKRSDVCMMSLAACSANPGMLPERFAAIQACRPHLNMQMQLSSSRVFVLLGLEAATLLFGDQPKNMQDVRGNWTELISPSGVKQFWFVTEHPGNVQNKVMEQLFAEDFKKLSSLLHYAWAVNMTELYPGSDFQHELSYEHICDVVANDVKSALLAIPPGEREDEFLRIMLRIFRDQTGLAARAFWDNSMAKKCGVDVDKPGWWMDRKGGERNG